MSNATLPQHPRRYRRRTILAVLLTGLTLFYAGTCLRLTLNGSHSLPHNGYLMVAWPKVVWRGAYVAVPPPDALKDQFHADAVFVKQVVGLPGDRLIHEAGGQAVCIRDRCAPLAVRDGQPFAPATPEQTVPAGHLAILGEAEDSLDSRYAIVGLFARADIQAVGIPLAVPHWTSLRDWIEGKP